MEENFDKTAILIFARTDEQEASAKTFVYDTGRNSNKAIARQLVHHTTGTSKKTRLTVFVVCGA